MVSASKINDAEKGILGHELSPQFPTTQTADSLKRSAITESSLSSIPLRALALNDKQGIHSHTNEGEGPVHTTMAPTSFLTRLAQKKFSKKKQTSRCIQFGLWFNTYRSVGSITPLMRSYQVVEHYAYRKFFIFVLTVNTIGILLAGVNIWTYPRKYTGAFVVGNLFTAILMRNELFGRVLYLIVNTLFAKVS